MSMRCVTAVKLFESCSNFILKNCLISAFVFISTANEQLRSKTTQNKQTNRTQSSIKWFFIIFLSIRIDDLNCFALLSLLPFGYFIKTHSDTQTYRIWSILHCMCVFHQISNVQTNKKKKKKFRWFSIRHIALHG